MRSFYLFEAPPRWEKDIDRGLMKSSESFLIGCFLLLDLASIADIWKRYALGSVHISAGLGIFLFLFLLLIFISSYSLVRLCNETRERLRSSFIDGDSRRTLLNVSYMGYRLYLILLIIPAIIFMAMQSVHP